MAKSKSIRVSDIYEALEPIAGKKPVFLIYDGDEKVMAMDANFTCIDMSIEKMLETYGDRKVAKYEVKSWTCTYYDSADITIWL